MNSSDQFLRARNSLLELGSDYAAARREFTWPQFEEFNWGRDYFDVVARGSDRPAIRVVDDAGNDKALSYSELAARSDQIADFLAARGVGPGDRVLVMLGNVIPLWEVMLAVIKLGAVMIPATTLLQGDDLADRLERGRVKAVVTQAAFTSRFAAFPDVRVRVVVDGSVQGWDGLLQGDPHPNPLPQVGEGAEVSLSPFSGGEGWGEGARTRADQLLLLYFTSGTTAKPKLVAHTHTSYPIGHLSTMYWLGLKPGDVHLNLSSAGWAKHAWSCFFAPFNAEATVLAYQYERFSAQALLRQLERCRVTTFCAPPTVWRFLVQEDLSKWSLALREVASAGEPLNPEVIEHVRDAWGLTIRDGFGQTETTAMIGNSPGQPLKVGSMGRPLPGYDVVLLAPDGEESDEGEICIDLKRRPTGLMQGYVEAEGQLRGFGSHYRTGDIASRDADGYFTYVGRADDVFKSSDYRISPFELESVLIEHVAVAEAAVVPSPDPRRLSVPKAFVVLAAGHAPDAETARSILAHVTARVSAFKRIRRLEFCDLPKTISGKIRRVELRVRETKREARRNTAEFWEEDL